MTKIYAHRGFRATKDIKSNSIASVNSAFANGFNAVEIDIWYYKKQLLVNHNQPTITNCQESPKLEEIFLHENKLSYWLDFKNLNSRNTMPAMLEIKDFVTKKKIDLEKIHFAPFIIEAEKLLPVIEKIREVFGQKVQITAVCEELEKKNRQKFYQFLQAQNIKFLSVKHDLIDADFVNIFQGQDSRKTQFFEGFLEDSICEQASVQRGTCSRTNRIDDKITKKVANCVSPDGIELFAWTVNDLKIMQNLIKLGVKNFTSDSITPKILNHENSRKS